MVNEFDPVSIHELDNWWVWDHHDLQRMVAEIDTGIMKDSGRWWQRMALVVNRRFAEFDREMAAALGAHVWQGRAVDAAARATRTYTEWGQAMSQAMSETGDRIQVAADAATATKVNLPPAKDFDLARSLRSALPFGVLGLAFDAYQQHQEAQHAKAEAVRVMNTYLTAGYREADARVPVFPDPPTVIVSDSSPGDGGGGPPTPAPTTPRQPPAPGPGPTAPSQGSAPPVVDGAPRYSGGPVPVPAPDSAPTWSSSFTAAPAGSPAAAPPESRAGGSAVHPGGGFGPVGSVGGAAGFGDPAEERSPAAGAAPGTGGPARPVPGRPAAGVGRAAAGLGPMAAGGRRASEEDGERTAKFVEKESHDKVFGLDQPYVKPVIGEG
jgi:hypothetical protein